MSPVPGNDEEAATAPVEHPGAAVAPTPAPTNVDAYKPRAIRNKHSPLAIAPLLLRFLVAIFSLISFAVIASASLRIISDTVFVDEVEITTYHFNYFFFFSYLLTVTVLSFIYAIATLVVSALMLSNKTLPDVVLISVFALDLIMSYLLISASTSAATGTRVEVRHYGSFTSKAEAAAAFGFLAFFAMAATALISGHRVATRS